MKKRVVVAMAAVLLTASGCGGNTPAEVKPEAKAKVVEVFTVGKDAQGVSMTATGLVEAKRDTQLAFGTSGKIAQVLVKKGDRVTQGKVLASLDGSYYQSAMTAAAGQVQEAAARKRKTIRGADAEQIAQQRLEVESANQRYEKAVQDFQQGERLFAGGAISQSELDKLKLEKQQAEITAKNEKIALDDLLKGADTEDVIAVDASLKQATSEVQRARQTLQDSQIIAPFTGTVVEVTQQAGELSGPGQSLIHLVDLSEIKVTIDVTNDQIDQYALGASVNVSKDGQKKSSGKITYISPVIDKQTGKYRVEITVPNPDQSWRGGMVATVEAPRKIAGVIVPLESVGINQTQRYVMAVENGLVKKRAVKTGQIIGDFIEVVEGVKPGEQLLRTGITYFVDGEKVVAKGE
ncbi:efflux RND transporter periplasmic adaptor subunit [Brevibacillus migulae]|uniref:efflux RND transporter periplasmic adaptor subunit n=1 Tax=Brevibacillus migulae TaxID=1644114 RepID=UPI00106E9E59|nr:efflux RND transporter periplasmic adaptor subunit [Brevibacillus migulae]